MEVLLPILIGTNIKGNTTNNKNKKNYVIMKIKSNKTKITAATTITSTILPSL